jgi:hypothetical protein
MISCAATISRWLPDWNVCIVAQEYTGLERAMLKRSMPNAETVFLPARVGMHNAKIIGLSRIEQASGGSHYVACSIDDDMEFIEQTNLEPCVTRALDPSAGLIAANWAPHENLLSRRPIQDKFIAQPIVYTGGGMLFSRHTAGVLLEIPMARYFSDNSVWSLATYVAGLTNYRYLGSLAIHRICQKGGRRAWVASSDIALPDSSLITIRRGKEIDGRTQYLIGTSDDLTDKAHQMHRDNRKKQEEPSA